MMNPRLHDFAWFEIASILGATAGTREGATLDAGTVVLTFADSRQLLVHENGGEFNATVREVNGSSSGPDFSIAYSNMFGALSSLTMAYRLLCVLDQKEIDYSLSSSDPVEVRRAAEAAPRHVEPYMQDSCTCRRTALGASLGAVCLTCRLRRGPLDSTPVKAPPAPV